jgi:hypothetical protein
MEFKASIIASEQIVDYKFTTLRSEIKILPSPVESRAGGEVLWCKIFV